MILAATSGLAGFAADVRDFLAALTFARPGLLWLLPLPTALWLLDRWADRRRRSAFARIGRPGAVAGQLTHPGAPGWTRGLAYSLGWTLLAIGLGGPRWGKSDETGVAVGRDVVVVIDLSRSMQADDMADRKAPTRWEAARDAALDLIDGMARRGGHRVAVVVFAARAKVLCPLTTDYDHARAVVADLDGLFPPPEIRPAAGTRVPSGTRIGAGLIAAVKSHDDPERFREPGEPLAPEFQDIVLVSDGDDPGDDKEWVGGATAARTAGIPVHTVGVGNPDAGTFLVFNDEPLETRLVEAPLVEIAEQTRGTYRRSRTEAPRLGEFFRTHIENPDRRRNRVVSDDSIPLPRERYAWFLAPALVLFAAGWLRGK